MRQWRKRADLVSDRSTQNEKPPRFQEWISETLATFPSGVRQVRSNSVAGVPRPIFLLPAVFGRRLASNGISMRSLFFLIRFVAIFAVSSVALVTEASLKRGRAWRIGVA